jgi:hypothetical protein
MRLTPTMPKPATLLDRRSRIFFSPLPSGFDGSETRNTVLTRIPARKQSIRQTINFQPQ